ncbi:MAG: N-acetylmuramoyl-L-alanine amidase [Glaciimonas sp.]|nr:N-acetylmuramoyl-L-alanine amidase [Glaciimonas sp.]
MIRPFFITLVAALISSSVNATENTAPPLKIAIDVGHSLKRPGSTSASGIAEFTFNRALALRLTPKLQALGMQPLLIGDRGDMDVLQQRTKLAQNQQLFISLHHDSIQPHYLPQAEKFSGYSLFVSRKNPQPAVSLSCAREVAKQLQAAGLHHTAHHAEPIKGENRPWADQTLGIYWFDDLLVLKTANQPALLIESGIIVNPQDEKFLGSNKGRDILSTAIAAGLGQCAPLIQAKPRK